jgi:hypothetical protein
MGIFAAPQVRSTKRRNRGERERESLYHVKCFTAALFSSREREETKGFEVCQNF